ncbi:hypothetical protein FRC04_010920 [Tulasnella sp. 424]|nr:hypothetical protein FRC04_010920 [Tulasnella sp. 424]
MERPGMTSIQDLPIELFLYIFRLSFDLTSLQRDRCRLSLVCHSWRDLMQESACLWTEISAHDSIHYVETSLAKSKDLPIDIYYLQPGGPPLRRYLAAYVNNQIIPQLSRCRSISLITQTYALDSFKQLLAELREKPAPRLNALILKKHSSHRQYSSAISNWLQLPETTAFPKLRRLEIDGVPCELSPPGLLFNNVLSLNLVDVNNVSSEQLLEVLRNSPSLERLELGRSPIACPEERALTSIHLPQLTALHLIFMPIPVSNFFLSILRAPHCSELFISSRFPEVPDDIVRGCLFTSSTSHFFPIIRTLLTRGRYRDIDIIHSDAQNMEFCLQFHDEECEYPARQAILRLQFQLDSVRQIEETIRWLADSLQQDVPKIPIRLFMDGFEDVHLMDLIDSHMTITHLAFRVPSDSNAINPNPILLHLGHPAQSGWPLPNLEVFVYGVAEEVESQDEAMLDMLRRRYVSSPEESDNARMLPQPIKKVRIGDDDGRCVYLLGEVQKILPQVESSLVDDDDSAFW